MKIKCPTKENFSDERLKVCFSLSFLKKLQKLNEKQYKCKNYIKDILDSLRDNGFKEKELREFRNKIINKSQFNQSILLMDCGNQKGREAYFRKYKQPKKCLFCSKRILDRGHILKQSFFKRKRKAL